MQYCSTTCDETGKGSAKNQNEMTKRNKSRKRMKRKEVERPLELWEIQKTLGRGEFVEV